MALKPHQVVGGTALLLWLASLALPAVGTDADIACLHPSMTWGWFMLLLGALGPLGLQFEWVANPLIVFAALRWIINRRTFGTGLLALPVAAGSFGWSDMTADTKEYVCHLQVGFYVWLAAAVLLALADIARRVGWLDPPRPMASQRAVEDAAGVSASERKYGKAANLLSRPHKPGDDEMGRIILVGARRSQGRRPGRAGRRCSRGSGGGRQLNQIGLMP